jgi:[ribosomal protein S5]-alanine N-acetyltransferase
MPPIDPSRFPALSTRRLKLRAVTPDDTARFHVILSLPEVTRLSSLPDAPSGDESAEFVQQMYGLFPSGTGCAWAIESVTSQDLIGAVRFNYFFPAWKCGEVGYELHPDFWGRGLMTEALHAVAACGHRFFALNRIDAWTLRGNKASDRVLEKSGFQYEGTARQKGWFKGAFHDLRIFGRVAADPMP